jgi:ferredoxin
MATTTIFYFSGTGNSLAVSKSIAGKLGDTSLIPIASENALDKITCSQKIGLVFPIYVFGLPSIVTRFIKNLPISNDVYTFAIAVHGGMPCGTLKQAERLFTQNGKTLSAGFEVRMVDNCIQIAGAIAPEKQKIRFEEAERKIDEICNMIKMGKQEIYSGWPMVNWLFNKFYNGWIQKAAFLDKNFSVDSNCNRCSLCEKVCGVKNIKIDDALPKWQHHCEQCFACLQWCPQKAIQYGKHTSGRTRYHHPDINISEIIIQN